MERSSTSLLFAFKYFSHHRLIIQFSAPQAFGVLSAEKVR